MKKRLVFIALLIVTIVLLIVPMLTHNEIVVNIERSSDMRIHLAVISGTDGKEASYFGQVILKYIMLPVAQSGNLDTIYLWFNFGVLIAIALTLYYVVKQLAGERSAMLVVPIVLFSTTGILALFTYGVIFNIINMYIILPFAILFTVYWLTGKGRWYILPAICLFVLFSVFHFTALYLPYVIAVAFVCYAVFAIKNREYKYFGKVTLFVVSIAGLNMLLASLFLDSTQTAFMNQQVSSFVVPTDATVTRLDSLLIGFRALKLYGYHLSVATGILLGVSIWGLVVWRKRIKWDKYNKPFIFILVCFVITLVGGLFMVSIQDFNRIALDLATITALLTVCLLGLFMKINPSKYVMVMVYILMALGAIPNMIAWVR